MVKSAKSMKHYNEISSITNKDISMMIAFSRLVFFFFVFFGRRCALSALLYRVRTHILREKRLQTFSLSRVITTYKHSSCPYTLPSLCLLNITTSLFFFYHFLRRSFFESQQRPLSTRSSTKVAVFKTRETRSKAKSKRRA